MGGPTPRLLAASCLGLLALATLGLGPGAPPPPGDRPPTNQNPRVCFGSAQGPVCVERPELAQAAPAESSPEDLLESMLAGPSPTEQRAGLRSAIPSGTTLDSVDVQGAEVTVRLVLPPWAVEHLDSLAVEGIVRQIAMTLEPVGWRQLHVEAIDAETGQSAIISSLLPSIEVPQKSEGPIVSGPLHDRSGESAPVGQPPGSGQGQSQGGLSGKTVYISAGHGWQWGSSGWRTQRPPYPTSPYSGPIIEDHNNAEAVNHYLLQYLWNAGAMVWPVRERDMGDFSAIVNNDEVGLGNSYGESGQWFTCSSPGYRLDAPGHTCRYAQTVVGPATAAATFTADLPESGRYAVYVWFRHGADMPPDARYTVRHGGGDTTVMVDQTRHGFTWHYIGTYGFEGSEGVAITLDNSSSVPGRTVVADAIRVGGGVLDDLSGIESSATQPPNKPWWEMAAAYYAQRQGLDPSGLSAYNDVIARPIYARWEHRGTGDDAVFLSWHTNAYSAGYQEDVRGLASYIHSERPTEGSAALQAAVHSELIHDIRAGWDATWGDLGTRTMDLGEVRELWDSDSETRMPGVLLEIGFHDHPDDTDALKDPRFELLAARAVYQGIVRYFEQRDGADLLMLPEPPTHLRITNSGPGRVTVEWEPGPVDGQGVAGDPATGYRVYVSADGLGWSDGVPTAETHHDLTGLGEGQVVFVRVSATNEGGESFSTETLGARVGQPAGVLLVSGFDRLNRFGLVVEDDPVEGLNLRMKLDRMNRYDYVVPHAMEIDYPLDSASNEAVASGDVSLLDYGIVDWIAGEEATIDVTLDIAEREAVAAFLENGGALLISGSEIAWDLDALGRDPAFYHNFLHAEYAADDAGTYRVAPVPGSLFTGLSEFRFDAPGEYDADYPDVLAPANGGVAALSYVGGSGGSAAVQYGEGCRRVVNLGFPFETVAPDARTAVMARILDFLDECLLASPATTIESPGDGFVYWDVPPFTGTAHSPSGLDRVEVSLRRGGDGAYWDGAGWGTDRWHVATGSSEWSWPLPDTLVAGAYTASACGWDTAQVSCVDPAVADFTVAAPVAWLPTVMRDQAQSGTGCINLIANGGFEDSSGWHVVDTGYQADYTSDRARSGSRSMRIGVPPGSSGGATTYSSISQTLSIPAGQAVTLHYWTYPVCQDPAGVGAQYVWLVDDGGNTQFLTPLSCENATAWDGREIALDAYAGQTVNLHFSVRDGGSEDVTATYLDDVSVEACQE